MFFKRDEQSLKNDNPVDETNLPSEIKELSKKLSKKLGSPQNVKCVLQAKFA